MLYKDQKIIFIVGNSRSGTKMLTTILSKSKEIFCFPEIHFFEQFYDFSCESLDRTNALDLLSTILCIAEKGYRGNTKMTNEERRFYVLRAEKVIEEQSTYHPLEVYFTALKYYADSKVPCDPTPRNQFYIEEISERIKHAKFLYLVRDPRDILLSQKNKWKARKGVFSRLDVIRTKLNYHPTVISKLWNASINQFEKHCDRDNLYYCKYEDFVSNPEKFLKEICPFVGVEYHDSMLDIHYMGSSMNKSDYKERGISTKSLGKWRDGLSQSEAQIAQDVCGEKMKKLGYEIENLNPSRLKIMYIYFVLPFQLALALVMNWNRMKNAVSTVRKRLSK